MGLLGKTRLGTSVLEMPLRIFYKPFRPSLSSGCLNEFAGGNVHGGPVSITNATGIVFVLFCCAAVCFMPRKSKSKLPTLDALPDTLDFRDRMFEPTLVEVPTTIPLSTYRNWRVPILDQGQEGACTGFGLATVANYLLRKRKVLPDRTPTSARMPRRENELRRFRTAREKR